jgi:dephospho-CoA kinase
VFNAPSDLIRLEQIVYPAVRRTIRAAVSNLPDEGTVVVDAVKLLDGELGVLMDVVWWVAADPKQQLERMVYARGLREEEARSRMAVQPSLDLYRNQVHAIIDNSGSLAETRNQVVAALSSVRIRLGLPDLPRISQ